MADKTHWDCALSETFALADLGSEGGASQASGELVGRVERDATASAWLTILVDSCLVLTPSPDSSEGIQA